MFYFFAIYSQVRSAVGSWQEINAHFKQQKHDISENMCCLSTLPAHVLIRCCNTIHIPRGRKDFNNQYLIV